MEPSQLHSAGTPPAAARPAPTARRPRPHPCLCGHGWDRGRAGQAAQQPPAAQTHLHGLLPRARQPRWPARHAARILEAEIRRPARRSAHAAGCTAPALAHPPRSRPPFPVSRVNLPRRATDAPLACPPADACVAESMPTISGGSNLDCVDMVVLPGGGAGTSGAPAADTGADAAEALAAQAPAAESDNESVDDGADDVPAPKFRKLICSEPPPAVRVSGCC